MKCITYIVDLWDHKITCAQIIAYCVGTVINSTLRILCLDSPLKFMVALSIVQ